MITLSSQGRKLLWLLYVAALVILVDQALDLVALVWPIRAGITSWRVGTFGLGMTRLEFLALADALAVAAALYLDHRKVLVFLAMLHLLLGLGVAAGMGFFVLDTLQIRRSMRPERVRELDLAAARTLLTAGAAVLACFAVTFGVWRTRQIREKEAKSREGFLVTGSPKGATGA